MTVQEILEEIENNFHAGQKRRFLPGLVISFIQFIKKLDAANGKYASLIEFYAAHPRRLISQRGGPTATLVVFLSPNNTAKNDKSLSIRGAYDKIERWFRSDNRRFDYPSMAPHATGIWHEYTHWLTALLALSSVELDELEESVRSFVLRELPAQDLDHSLTRKEPPRFYLFLEDFDLGVKKGEKSGAAYQGTVFGYLRADAAHLQVDVGSVRTGSNRVGRVGDIDAREGEYLVLSAEVKQSIVKLVDVPGFTELADSVTKQKALGLVVALEFEPGVRDALKLMGLEPVSKQDLKDRVRLWDSLKQKTAVQALLYYLHYKEKNSALYGRVKAFFDALDVSAAAMLLVVPSVPTDPTDDE